MKKIAVLASDNMMPDATSPRADMFERDEQMGKLVPAFKAQGLSLELLPWRGAADVAHDYAAMMPLFAWDYFEGNEKEFLAEMAKVDSATSLLNNYSVLRWNLDKTYLAEMGRDGAPVIKTVTVERLTPTNLARAFETLDTDCVVVKPQIGGGGWRQCLCKKGEPFPDKDKVPPREALIQAFLPSVQIEGEYSLLYFGGQYSHAVQKKPKSGDYRIQSLYGGTETTFEASTQDKAQARKVLDSLSYTPVYARIDFLRGRDDRLKLIELEMVEPYLYLSHAPGEGGENLGAQRLAKAVAKKLA